MGSRVAVAAIAVGVARAAHAERAVAAGQGSAVVAGVVAGSAALVVVVTLLAGLDDTVAAGGDAGVGAEVADPGRAVSVRAAAGADRTIAARATAHAVDREVELGDVGEDGLVAETAGLVMDEVDRRGTARGRRDQKRRVDRVDGGDDGVANVVGVGVAGQVEVVVAHSDTIVIDVELEASRGVEAVVELEPLTVEEVLGPGAGDGTGRRGLALHEAATVGAGAAGVVVVVVADLVGVVDGAVATLAAAQVEDRAAVIAASGAAGGVVGALGLGDVVAVVASLEPAHRAASAAGLVADEGVAAGRGDTAVEAVVVVVAVVGVVALLGRVGVGVGEAIPTDREGAIVIAVGGLVGSADAAAGIALLTDRVGADIRRVDIAITAAGHAAVTVTGGRVAGIVAALSGQAVGVAVAAHRDRAVRGVVTGRVVAGR